MYSAASAPKDSCLTGAILRIQSLPPQKEVMFLLQSVCLSVCLSDRRITEKLWTDFDEISWRVWHGLGTNGINFGDDPDHRLDLGVRSPKSGFTGLSKKYLVDSDQSCIANLHCKNHSAILLCRRSVEVCALWVLLIIHRLVSIQTAQREFVSFKAEILNLHR